MITKRASGLSMVFPFCVTVFLSAFLLFFLEPMVGKILLPALGGAPGVWNSCMVFFQLLYLGGCVWVYGLTRWVKPKAAQIIHLVALLIPWTVLPVAQFQQSLGAVPNEGNPVPWILSTLAIWIGPPLLAVSTTGPLMQKWFSHTQHSRASDPYFLYVASNAGSLIGLIAYPFLIESRFSTASQARYWTLGYALLFVFVLSCALFSRSQDETPLISTPNAVPLDWKRWTKWIVMALVPSSLMLGTTAYLSEITTAVPLLWVMPLALYLITLMIAFSPSTGLFLLFCRRLLPFLAVPWLVYLVQERTSPFFLTLSLHLVSFFVAALACHACLAEDRPEPASLPEFYVAMAVGGALGGVFNCLMAPQLFSRYWEYPIAIVGALALGGLPLGRRWNSIGVEKWVAMLGLLGVVAAYAFTQKMSPPYTHLIPFLVTFSVGALLLLVSRTPSFFALGMAAVVVVASIGEARNRGTLLSIERNFFGLVKVVQVGEEHHLLIDAGNHNQQDMRPDRRKEPLGHLAKSSSVGQLLTERPEGLSRRVAVIGLGAGCLAVYARPGETWDYYEINPAVVRAASNPELFTYLSDSPAKIEFKLGDARRRLTEVPDGTYDIIILDAYASAAIPVHLTTRESMALYIKKLNPKGFLISNSYSHFLRLDELLASLAQDAGLHAVGRFDRGPSQSPFGYFAMSVRPENLSYLNRDSRWRALAPSPVVAWTDGFSSVASILMAHPHY